MHMCPVCGYKGLRHPPKNHLICPSCGTQFGYNDVGLGPTEKIYAGLRAYWIKNGKRWHSQVVPEPFMWNADQQLLDANLIPVKIKIEETSTSGFGIWNTPTPQLVTQR